MAGSTKLIFEVFYPNGRTSIGNDLTNTRAYFGRVRSEIVAKDFSSEERNLYYDKKYQADYYEDIVTAPIFNLCIRDAFVLPFYNFLFKIFLCQ